MFGYRMKLLEDLYPFIIERNFDFFFHILMRINVVVFILSKIDMGGFHHGAYFGTYQLMKKFRKCQWTVPIKYPELLFTAFLTFECIVIVIGYQRNKCSIEAY